MFILGAIQSATGHTPGGPAVDDPALCRSCGLDDPQEMSSTHSNSAIL